ncbi:beta-1,3-glucan-binding protein-like [Cylas formicarius]|uniref:beta-1,3-glucan-binding protein-like n=1 Tax=Cylas formicarius TaxID=197179 RepID=UPI002958D6B0|nr:beta-1,3-glucan-binding protein-like [Cylas formicarius]
MWKVSLHLFALVCASAVAEFEVPDATIEAYSPEGLKVSIPDVDGIKLFAFHGKVNEEMEGREAGTFSSDVTRAKDGSWTFYDPNAKLSVGDTLYYWTFADYYDGENKLGYVKEDQEFTVTVRLCVIFQIEYSATMVVILNILLFNFFCGFSEAGLSVTEVSGSLTTKRKLKSGQLIFEDNFDVFDSYKWQHEPNGNSHLKEFQWYTNSSRNSYVENGILHIKPTLYNETGTDPINEPNFYPIRSARISTEDLFAFKYGFVEINAKIPSGDWLFPALWMMPSEGTYTKVWPLCGEIDIMEAAGNKNLTNSQQEPIGQQRVSSTLHWGPSRALDRWRLTFITKNDPSSFSSTFRKYQLQWSPQGLTFFVDGEESGTISTPDGGFWNLGNFNGTGFANPWINGTNLAPFDQKFFLIINLAVGGTSYFSDNSVNAGGKPWQNNSPNASADFWNARSQWLPTWNPESDDSHFQIDYVRVWAL